ncbi:hypothetical protein [Streptomyces parvulus]|uniref:hypothetical protein n=1 Tax=Streptomyces parvulus TaxID=146923 RepID=UPI00368AF7E4
MLGRSRDPGSRGGIVGATPAYWLRARGFTPTVVERAPAPRTGGHAIGIRGTGREVIERTGLVRPVLDSRIAARGMACPRCTRPAVPHLGHTGPRIPHPDRWTLTYLAGIALLGRHPRQPHAAPAPAPGRT